MTDEAFTKIAGKLLTNVRDLVHWGIEEGHTTAEKLRLTVAARREATAKLIEGGMSQREAAKALGVGLGTVQRDLAQSGSESDPKRVTKAERRAEREVELAAKQSALPAKRYGVIVADPEWRFEPYSRETGLDRAADNHYPTSDIAVIAARPVANIAADDCALFLWATVPMLREAIRVMEDHWQFEYRSHAVWDKVHIGTGYWFRNRHELLLLGIKGNPPCPAMGEQFASVMTIARKEHSAKPDQFLEIIEQYFPNLPKIELNRRGPARPGWDAWGNEAEIPEAAE